MRPDTELTTLIQTELRKLTCRYAFYCRPQAGAPLLICNHEGLFASASIIKVPILYAWAHLEAQGEVDRDELCDLDMEPPVQGAGLSWLLRARRLPYADVLLMMIALSDNLCTNLVIRRLGIERLARVFREQLGLVDTRLERKLMDYEARSRGLDNWISAEDCIRLYDVRRRLPQGQKAWVDELFLACVDGGLWLRNIPRDTVLFHHKTGSMEGVLHDWGYTDACELFLLTQDVADESEVYRALDVLGPALLGPAEQYGRPCMDTHDEQ